MTASEVTEHMSKRRRNMTVSRPETADSGLSPGPSGTTLVPSPPESSAPENASLGPAPDENVATGMSEDTYLKERSTLIEVEQKSADQHDKAILTVSMGGLALSVTFLKDIVPRPLPDTLVWMKTSWAFFVASLLIILASFLTSQSACRKQRDFLDRLYLEGPNAAIHDANRWSTITNWLNFASYILVFLAVLFLTLFSWLNLK